MDPRINSNAHKRQRLKESTDPPAQPKPPPQAQTTKQAPTQAASRPTDILPGPSKKGHSKHPSHNVAKASSVASGSKVTASKAPSKGPIPQASVTRPPVPSKVLFDPIGRHRSAVAGALGSVPQRTHAPSTVNGASNTNLNHMSTSTSTSTHVLPKLKAKAKSQPNRHSTSSNESALKPVGGDHIQVHGSTSTSTAKYTTNSTLTSNAPILHSSRSTANTNVKASTKTHVQTHARQQTELQAHTAVASTSTSPISIRTLNLPNPLPSTKPAPPRVIPLFRVPAPPVQVHEPEQEQKQSENESDDMSNNEDDDEEARKARRKERQWAREWEERRKHQPDPFEELDEYHVDPDGDSAEDEDISQNLLEFFLRQSKQRQKLKGGEEEDAKEDEDEDEGSIVNIRKKRKYVATESSDDHDEDEQKAQSTDDEGQDAKKDGAEDEDDKIEEGSEDEGEDQSFGIRRTSSARFVVHSESGGGSEEEESDEALKLRRRRRVPPLPMLADSDSSEGEEEDGNGKQGKSGKEVDDRNEASESESSMDAEMQEAAQAEVEVEAPEDDVAVDGQSVGSQQLQEGMEDTKMDVDADIAQTRIHAQTPAPASLRIRTPAYNQTPALASTQRPAQAPTDVQTRAQAPTQATPDIAAAIARFEENLRNMRAEWDAKWERERMEGERREREQAEAIVERERERKEELERERERAREKERVLEIQRVLEIGRERERERKEESEKAREAELEREQEREKQRELERERERVRGEELEKAREAEWERELEREKEREVEREREKQREIERAEREQERERERVREEEREKTRQTEQEREKQREVEREQERELERSRKLQHALELQRLQKQAQAQAQLAAPPLTLTFPPELEERIAQRVLEALQPALESMRAEREAEKLREREGRAVEKAREKEERLLERTVEKAEEREAERAREEKAKEEKAVEERDRMIRAEREREEEKAREREEQMRREKELEGREIQRFADLERREKEREEREVQRLAELERRAAERESQREKEREQEKQRLLESERRTAELEAQRGTQRKEEQEAQKTRDEARDKATADMYSAFGILAGRVGVVLNVLGVRSDGSAATGGGDTAPSTAAPKDTSFAAIGRKRRRLASGIQDIEVGADAGVEVIDVDMDETPQSRAGAEGKSVLDRLTGVEMDIQECLERLRDPLAGFNVEMQALAQAQFQAGGHAAPASPDAPPTIARREMGTSPFRAEHADVTRTRKRKLLWGVNGGDDELVDSTDSHAAESPRQQQHNREIEKQLKDMMERMVTLSELINKNSQDSQKQNVEMNEKFKNVMERIASISSTLDNKLSPRAHKLLQPSQFLKPSHNYDRLDELQDDDEEGVHEQAQDEDDVDVFGPFVVNSSPHGPHGPFQAGKNNSPEVEGAASLDKGREDDSRSDGVQGGGGSEKDKGKERERGEVDVDMDAAMRVEEKPMDDVRVGFQDESSLPQLQSTPRCDVPLDDGKMSTLQSNVTPRMNSRSKSRSKSTTSQFSPVDWSKTASATRERSVVLKLSPNAKLVLGPPSAVQRSVSDPTNSTTHTPLKMPVTSPSAGGKPISATPPQVLAASRSYTLPPPMEGSIAALRKVSLGTAYTDAYVYGDALSKDRGSSGMSAEDERSRMRKDDRVDMVMGADAGERMLSPESEEEKDEKMEERDRVEKKEMVQGSARSGIDSTASKSLTRGLTLESAISTTSSLSTLTSFPSASSASSIPVSMVASGSRLGSRSSPSPSPSAEPSSAVLSPVDLQNAKLGPPSKESRLESTSPSKPSGSAATLPVPHTSSTTTVSSTMPFLGSQTTEEDEAAVQSLVMVGSQDREDLDAGDNSMATVEGMIDHAQESTPIPTTPQKDDRNEVIPSSCSPPVMDKGKGKAVDRDLYDEEMGDDDGRMSQPYMGQAEHLRGPSSPLFTSPSQPPTYGDDASYNDEDIMDTSTASRSKSKVTAGSSKSDSDGHSETRRIVKAKREMNSPISVPPPKGNIEPAQDYDYISSATPSPVRPAKSSQAKATTSKASTSKSQANEIVVIDFDSPPPTSFMRTSPSKSKKTLRKKGERSNTSASIISISSGSEDEAPKATQKAKSSQQPKSATLEQRVRPRPIPVTRRKSAAKIEIFSPPAPEVVDLTTPVRNDSAAVTGSRRRGFSPPPSPLASTSKSKVDAQKPVEKPPVQDKPFQKAPQSKAAPEPTPEEYYSSPLSSEEDSTDKAPPAPESSFDIEKYSARLAEEDSDDDADIIIVKKKKPPVRKTPSVSTSGRKSTSSAGGMGVKPDPDGDDAMDTIPAAAASKTTTRMAELLAARGKKQSAAMTRVKKRKRSSGASSSVQNNDVDGTDDEDAKYKEPPLKRAKARSVAAASVSTSASASEKERGKPASKAKDTRRESLKNKEKVKEEGSPARYSLRSPRKENSVGSISASVTTPRRKRAQGVVWPKVDNPNYDLFVKCDLCYLWYHIGCAGMGPDDVRLRETEIYECPTCVAGIPKEQSPSKKVHDEDVKGSNACARQYCLLTYVNRRGKARKSQAADDSSYVVEALVGRYKKVTGGHGISYMYLVKWQNYDYNEATVQTIDSMGMSNPGPLLDAFEKQAAAEGIDLNNAGDTVLLREAAQAGWTDNLVFVKPE